jgi:anti-anti-sigma regulatory factor
MNVTTSRAGTVVVMRVNEPRLTFPILYVDSATIGCLMDLYRQASAAGGAFKLVGVQKRVETMLTMTGAQHFLEVHPDEPSALASFGG